jgi:hypothetical protein
MDPLHHLIDHLIDQIRDSTSDTRDLVVRTVAFHEACLQFAPHCEEARQALEESQALINQNVLLALKLLRKEGFDLSVDPYKAMEEVKAITLEIGRRSLSVSRPRAEAEAMIVFNNNKRRLAS